MKLKMTLITVSVLTVISLGMNAYGIISINNNEKEINTLESNIETVSKEIATRKKNIEKLTAENTKLNAEYETLKTKKEAEEAAKEVYGEVQSDDQIDSKIQSEIEKAYAQAVKDKDAGIYVAVGYGFTDETMKVKNTVWGIQPNGKYVVIYGAPVVDNTPVGQNSDGSPSGETGGLTDEQFAALGFDDGSNFPGNPDAGKTPEELAKEQADAQKFADDHELHLQ